VAKAARTTAVVAILGLDSFRAEAALEQLLDKAVGKERGDTVQVFRGDESNWTRVVDAARTGSLFAPRRAVVVRGADQLKGDGDDLQAFMADPPTDVVLVLLAGKPDKRKTLWKRITETATIVDAEPLKGRALQSYVADEIRRRGLKLSADGVSELLERVGQDLRRLMGELDKLEAYAGQGKSLDADEVAKVLGRGIARPLYRLADAMMVRQKAEVLVLIDELLEEGEPALRMLATLHRVVRQTRVARALGASRVPRDQFAARLGIPPFKIGDVMEASRRWSDDELKAAIRALSRADLRIKSGTDPRLALTALVSEVCGPAASARRTGVR
jgi:DNA polymerase-3 subunit delta